MNRFLIDEDLPRSTARVLNQNGVAAADVRDTGLRGAEDKRILSYAAEHRLIVVSADLGMGDRRNLRGLQLGVVLVRLPNETSIEETVAILVRALTRLSDMDLIGKLVVIDRNKIRIRHLIAGSLPPTDA